MQDMEMTNNANPALVSGKARTKKKSTLTKLKERKEREMGSCGSIQRNDHENKSILGTVEQERNTTSGNKPLVYNVSTKDSYVPPSPMDTSPSTVNTKPRPKPRTHRRISSSELNLEAELSNKTEIDDSLNGSSDTVTLQRLKNLKMVTDQSESGDGLANARFVPKPPLTPRSSKNTPRTPRALVSSGKREKRIREPWSSGDEHEIEEKREKNGDEHPIHSNLFEISDLEMVGPKESPSEAPASHGKEKSEPSSNTQTKSAPRLLKRRGSKDTPCAEVVHNVVNAAEKNSGDFSYSDNNSRRGIDNHNSSDSAPLPNKTPKQRSNSKTRNESPNSEKTKPPRSPKSSPKSNGAAATSVSRSNPDRKQTECHMPSHDDNVADQTETSNRAQITLSAGETSRSITTPPSGHLEPISPRSLPPPLPKEFSSHALKTAYKIDPNVRPFTSSSTSGRPRTHSDSGGASNDDKLSQRSFASGSIMPMITTKEARSRSFLEGSIRSATPSMLGLEELERYFPERKINILVGTWNMNELKDVTSSLDDFILPVKCDYVQDIYAIGTQENNMNKKEWEIKLQETLGPSHVLFHSVTLGSIHLVVFIRRDLIWFCSEPEDNTLSLRAVTMVKTKGAIGISFTLFGSSFLFINCHLTSDRDNVNSRKKNRCGDYFKVIQEMDFKFIKQSKAESSKKQVDITALYDNVIWCGDLNFRIERQRHAVEGRVNQITSEKFPNFETLLGGDQLLKFMMEGKIFDGFQEGRINFHPTFKFDVNTDSYDTSSKNRVPSYTDRIVFRSRKKNDITCLHYDAVMDLKISDHRPVFGQFEAGIKPGRDNMVYGAGHFDRSVFLEANQRRAANRPAQKKSSSSSVCSIQ